MKDEMGQLEFRQGEHGFRGKIIPRRILPPDRNNFGPRLGLAYTPAFLEENRASGCRRNYLWEFSAI